jgi:hypothetical protein
VPVTFDELCEREPALRRLYDEARAERRQRRSQHYCANRVWYGRLKPQLLRLVGWERPDRDPVLGSSDAYDIAYDEIYQALPDCQDCSCLSLGGFR